jgi:5-methylcytosine-specific restriction endonuclease McrA
MQVLNRPPSGWPALVLNADYRPLSYYPLSLWPWQEVVKAVFLDRVDVIATYDKTIHSPTFEMHLPSVVSLKHYVAQDRPPAFTRFNLFLRDGRPVLAGLYMIALFETIFLFPPVVAVLTARTAHQLLNQ